ncbi:Mn2+ and Fe2+ transporter of the NRAMP family [Halanaeroarchaeum sp. HSR-CO]|nr:Mn2+ and Fe2+ transporter of the NRAMP family [Halanaeroarchaeum sp. HSR-CO]
MQPVKHFEDGRMDGDRPVRPSTESGAMSPPTHSENGSPPDEEVYASDTDGQRYRTTAFIPSPYDELEVAPASVEYPDRGRDEGRYRILDLPKAPKLRHVVGPSAIMLGASLGSGESLFWPYIIAQNGWALYWAFVVGVITQYFVNTEIQRWTLATGESVFRAFERVSERWTWAFLVGGFISLGWPGWAASAAQVGAVGLGIGEGVVSVAGVTVPVWKIIAISLLLLIWLSYHLSSVMYRAVETAQTAMVVVAVVLALLLVAVVGSYTEFVNVPRGAVSIGTLPEHMDLAVFLGALAYAGAGGYLNLSQSLWVREKGYAMSIFQGRIRNPLLGDEPEPVHRDGFAFPPTRINLERWKAWWRLAQLEHLVTFALGLFVVATAMMTVSAAYAPGTTAGAVAMWLQEIVPLLGDGARILVYLVLFVALFTTEYAIVESFVRNSSDILFELVGRDRGWSLPQIFWWLLTAFIAWGIVIIAMPFNHPFGLLVRSAAMSGIMMWPYIALTLVINTNRLPEHLTPGWARVVIMWWATAFFGFFSTLLIGDTLVRIGLSTFQVGLEGATIGVGGALLWAGFGLAQVATMVFSIRGKRGTAGTVPGAESVQSLFR